MLKEGSISTTLCNLRPKYMGELHRFAFIAVFILRLEVVLLATVYITSFQDQFEESDLA